ncbi:hypothetical protein LCGC14_3079450, partial [marine sediment metagenome]
HLWSVATSGRPMQHAFFRGDLLWVLRSKPSYGWAGLDLVTGEERRRIAWSTWGGRWQRAHSKGRCFRSVASGRYVLCGDLDLVDLEAGKVHYPGGARGVCRVGVLPANGLLYAFPVDCICRPFLRGFLALAATAAPGRPEATDRLQRGDAGAVARSALGDPGRDWPSYRHDSRRSGATSADVPGKMKLLWRTKIGRPARGLAEGNWAAAQSHDTVTAPAIAAGTVFLAARDVHQVTALDAADGRVRWRFTAGGRVDQPPTIHRGLCLFGSRDGWVYCLRAADGRLVWRFRAAPEDRRIIVDGQLESPWPVAGSVLVQGGTAFFAAGRHAKLDGGVTVFAAEPATGKVLW